MFTEAGSVHAIVQASPDAIITADRNGDIVMWNPAAETMFGWTADDVVGRSLTVLVPERFRDAHRSGLARVVETGETHILGSTVQVAGLRKDGTEFPIELSLATWFEGDNRYFTGMIRDVSERVRLTADLLHSQERLDAILRSANDAIVSLDVDGRVVLWNTHAAALFGYTEEEMMGEPITAIVPERFRDAHTNGIARVAGGGEHHVIGSTVELAGLHRDGREMPIELSLATWSSDGERFFSGIMRDITDRKRAEEAIQVANKSLAQKNEQLEALSAKLAKYLSRQVYDSIFAGRTDVKVESYRKELTVFFSDIQGFTDLTDRMEAEPVAELLNNYLSEMSYIADECGGTIDKFIGDGIMIFFGDPESRGRTQDALQCVGMAVRMRDRIAGLRREWGQIVGPADLHVRMGVNTGYCTVGNFGSEDRMDYTIVGGPVNVASRLESSAGRDQILISHETYALVKNVYYCRPIGEIRVKGVAHPVRTYEVVGLLSEGHRQPIHVTATGFNLLLDPGSISATEAAEARKALQQALDALGDGAARPEPSG